MNKENRPTVGVGLLVVRGNKVLLGKRQPTHARGEYGGVGGHFEYQESLEGALLRELSEEAGPNLKVKNLKLLAISNMTRYPPRHFVVVSFVAEWESGEPEANHEVASWKWYDLNDLPSPLYSATAQDIEAYKTGRMHFDDAKQGA